jgi:hypothetical protein
MRYIIKKRGNSLGGTLRPLHRHEVAGTVTNATPCQYPLRLLAWTKNLFPSNAYKLSNPIKNFIKIMALGLKSIAPLKISILMFQHRFDKVAIFTKHDKD